MRHFTVKFHPERGWFHPFDRVLADDPDVDRVAIHDMKLLEDGDATMLYEFGGDLERAREVVEEQLGRRGYQAAELEKTLLVYSTFEPNPTTRGLLEIPRRLPIVVESPMVFDERGNLQVTLVGEESTVRQALEAVPDDVLVSIECTGPYRPDAQRLFALLTPSQQRTVKAAVEVGYYDVPRRATYEDVADRLGVTGTTVGEHLRKIEAQFVKSAVPTAED